MSKCVICFWCPRCPSSQEPKDAETGCNDCNGRWYHKTPRSGIRLMRFTVAKFVRNETVSKSFTVFLGRCQEYVTWKASWNLGPSLRHPQILRLLFRCHDTSAAHGCSHSFSVRVSLSLQLQSAGVNDVHVLLWRFWPTRRVFSDRWAMNTGNFWDQITSSRHITAEFCGFVGQRPSSRLKWGTLHSELKLSMSTLSRCNMRFILTYFDYLWLYYSFKAVLQYDDSWNFVQWPWLFLVFAQAQWQIPAQTLTLPIAKKALHHQTVTIKRSVSQCLKKWFIACETRTQLEVRTEDLIIIL